MCGQPKEVNKLRLGKPFGSILGTYIVVVIMCGLYKLMPYSIENRSDSPADM